MQSKQFSRQCKNVFSTFLATYIDEGEFISHSKRYLMRTLHLRVIPTPNCVYHLPCQTCKYENQVFIANVKELQIDVS